MQCFKSMDVYVAAWHVSIRKHVPNPVEIPFVIAEQHLTYKNIFILMLWASTKKLSGFKDIPKSSPSPFNQHFYYCPKYSLLITQGKQVINHFPRKEQIIFVVMQVKCGWNSSQNHINLNLNWPKSIINLTKNRSKLKLYSPKPRRFFYWNTCFKHGLKQIPSHCNQLIDFNL